MFINITIILHENRENVPAVSTKYSHLAATPGAAYPPRLGLAYLGHILSNVYGDYITRLNADFQRVNKDPKVNNMGRALIEFCQIQNLNILNGRFGHDKGIGKLTCFNRNQGKSTIDYAVISATLLEVVNDFEIGEFDEFLSDTHCAISVLL